MKEDGNRQPKTTRTIISIGKAETVLVTGIKVSLFKQSPQISQSRIRFKK